MRSSFFQRESKKIQALILLGAAVGLILPPAWAATKTPKAKSAKSSDKKPLKKTKAVKAEPTPEKNGDLTQMSLENLAGMDVIVTSASKKEESLRDATSAIFVITQEDICRSGFQHVADLLRMVPGVQVASQSANEWAISARGFNAQYNNKMLVLVDGRSVYDPVFGGVNWNQQDIPLAEIDHIEVIRGPGGTLWGSNAVNGIVNITTKDSKATQGLLASVAGGTNLYAAGTTGTSALNGKILFQYGAKLSDDLYYRVFARVNNQNPSANPKADIYEATLPNTWNDGWYDFRAGFRMDLHSDQDHLTLSGEAQKGYFDYARLSTPIASFFNPNTFAATNDLNTSIDQNVHILGRWTRDFADDSQIQALGYYDYNNMTTANDSRITNVGQLDLEFQHRFHLGSWNEVTWGASYRNVSDQFFNPINIYYTPDRQDLNVYGGFLQDRLSLVEGQLSLTLGAKLENNPYTGNEWQPSGKLLFTPDERNSFWVSISRAVRMPYQVGRTATIYLQGVPANFYGAGNPPVDTYAAFVPNPNSVSETLISHELGFRTNLSKEASLDIAGFYNHYENLLSFQFVPGQFVSPAGGVIDGTALLAVQAQNTGMGNIYGVEVATKWNPLPNLKINLSYTYQGYDQPLINSSNLEIGAPPPHDLANVRVYFDPIPELELNTALYFTDTTFMYDPNDVTTNLDIYWKWNCGATWKPTPNLRLSLWGMDLEGAHTETLQSAFISPAQVVPKLYGQATLEY